MSNPNECPRCGATTPHQTFAKLAAVNMMVFYSQNTT